MRARGLVDVLIPRGGASLIRTVVEESTVPVIETGTGNCHVYVDEQRRPRHGRRHPRQLQGAAPQRLQRRRDRPRARGRSPTRSCRAPLDALAEAGRDRARRRGVAEGGPPDVVPATDEDWGTEYLSYDIAAAVVPSLDAAVAHIRALDLRAHRGDRHRATPPRPAASPRWSTPRPSW